MDNLHYRLLMIQAKKEIPGKKLSKVVKFQDLVAKDSLISSVACMGTVYLALRNLDDVCMPRNFHSL